MQLYYRHRNVRQAKVEAIETESREQEEGTGRRQTITVQANKPRSGEGREQSGNNKQSEV